MSDQDGIHGFLAALRRRLLLCAGMQAAGYGGGRRGGALLALGLIAAAVGPAGFWPVTTMVVLGVLALGAFGYGVWRPARALRDTEAAARRAGGLSPSWPATSCRR